MGVNIRSLEHSVHVNSAVTCYVACMWHVRYMWTGNCRTKFLSDDWMVERKFLDEQASTNEKSAWLVIFLTTVP